MMNDDHAMPAVNRREFLQSAPRRLLRGVKALMNDATAFAAPVSDGPERATHPRVALVDVSRCLAWSGTNCQVCYLQCPQRDDAITLEEGRPTVVTSVCDGCGVCVEACRAVNDLEAIQLVSGPTRGGCRG